MKNDGLDCIFRFQLIFSKLSLYIYLTVTFQLLEPAQYPWLLKSLYGLLMLLPQVSA